MIRRLCHTICKYTLCALPWLDLTLRNRYCVVGIAIMFLGVVWWALWRVVPRWFGYKVVSRKEVLTDGTVVSLVRAEDWSCGKRELTDSR